MLAALVGSTTFVGGLLAAPVDFDQDIFPEQTSVLLLADDGTQFASIPPPTRRTPVPATEIPVEMRQAIISAEDARFLEHDGVDALATLRAAYRDLTGGRRQGGSTLTQQYVKNAYVGNDRTLLRKVREAALSVRLEGAKSKEQILTDYLNALYLGNGVYGVQAAARYYFGVDVRQLGLNRATGQDDANLRLARAALLAGIAPAPSVWNPVRDLRTAKARQMYTLNQMVTNGYITSVEASRAIDRGITPVRETPPEPPTGSPEYADRVRALLRDRFEDDEDVLFRGGLRIRTTLDLDLQEAVSRAAREVLPDQDDPQASVVAVDVRNGDVKAMTTLRRYPAKTLPPRGDGTPRPPRPAASGYQRNGFNIATDQLRQAGSTIKVFTLAEALRQGMGLDTTRYAAEVDSIPNPRGAPDPYVYGNSEPGESGTYTLRRGLALSVNTLYLPLANELGRGRVAELAEASGLRGRVREVDGALELGVRARSGNLSFGVGAVDVTPLSVAGAYATLANHGVRMPPRYVTEIRSTAVPGAPSRALDSQPDKPAGTRVMPADVADRVTEAMRDVVTRGTGGAAAQPFEVFGKTGTTNGSTDAWWVGCARSPQNVCISVWMGYEDRTCAGVQGTACGGMRDVNGVEQVYGGTLPARIFARTFEVLREIQAGRAAPGAGR